MSLEALKGIAALGHIDLTESSEFIGRTKLGKTLLLKEKSSVKLPVKKKIP
jgi:hypothetical protein